MTRIGDDRALTVVILTLNEAERLRECLAAIPPRYPVLIVDSGSRDGTVEIARAEGCKIVENPWPGFADQRNFALEKAGIETDWVLFVDADEKFDRAFYEWFEANRHRDDFDIAQISQILYFRGKALRHAPAYPLWHPRLARRGAVRFVRNHTGHGEAANREAREIFVDIPYHHDWYDGDIAGWMTKHVALAAAEADLRRSGAGRVTPRARLSLMVGSAWLRVPLRFLFHFIWRGGFLDGRRGLEFSAMYGWFEATKGMIRLGNKAREKR